VNIAYDGDGSSDVHNVTFAHEDFFDLFAYCLECCFA